MAGSGQGEGSVTACDTGAFSKASGGNVWLGYEEAGGVTVRENNTPPLTHPPNCIQRRKTRMEGWEVTITDAKYGLHVCVCESGGGELAVKAVCLTQSSTVLVLLAVMLPITLVQ